MRARSTACRSAPDAPWHAFAAGLFYYSLVAMNELNAWRAFRTRTAATPATPATAPLAR